MSHKDPDLPDTFKRSGPIIISPTDKKLFKLARTDSVKFYAVAGRIKLARLFLDSLGIEYYEKLATETILIKQKNGIVLKINLENIKWEIILFNGKDLPVLADNNSFETFFNKYMKN